MHESFPSHGSSHSKATSTIENNPWTYVDPYGEKTAAKIARDSQAFWNATLPENFVGHALYGATHFLTTPLTLGESIAEVAVNHDRLTWYDTGLLGLDDVGKAFAIAGGTGTLAGGLLSCQV